MFPKPFNYVAPATLSEALVLLQRHGDEARVLAGGQSLLPLMKLRFVDLENLIDLRRLSELRGIEEKNEHIRCGAMVTHSEIERSELIARRIPLLRHAAAEIADVQVRNRGTIGGALCQADPAGDWAVACLALDACMQCTGPKGKRLMSAAEFFIDTYTTALAHEEILTDVRFPIPSSESVGVYIKLRKRSGDFAIASVAVQAQFTLDGQCEKLGIGMGGVAPTPLHLKNISAFLMGKRLEKPAIQEACAMLDQYIDPLGDLRGSADYKRKTAAVVLERALLRVQDGAKRRASV